MLSRQKVNIKASIIIPNWNGKYLLKECLDSLKRQTFGEFQIIIVDNGSTDGSVDYINKFYPEVKLIKLDKNYGFAKAINTGVKNSTAKHVVFLNNDTKADKNWLKSLVEFADTNDDVISVNSKILNYFDRKLIDGVGIEINEVGQARSIGWNQKDSGQFDKEMYIFGATGGASLFKRKEFISLGMFDENYFMYSEEVDFAFRAQFLGYKSIFCPKAIVYHKHKATSKKLPTHVEYWQFRNMTQTIIKDFPREILFKNWRLLKIILVHFNTIFYQLKNGFWWAPFLADIWILFHFPHLLHERKKIQSGIRVSSSHIEGFLKDKKITFWGLMPK